MLHIRISDATTKIKDLIRPGAAKILINNWFLKKVFLIELRTSEKAGQGKVGRSSTFGEDGQGEAP